MSHDTVMEPPSEGTAAARATGASEPMSRGETGRPAVRIVGLTKTFRGHLGLGKTPGVRSLDLEVRRGESFGLLGPNGAGKTTTIKMLVGLLRPDGGTVELLGRSPKDPAARARLGYLPENPYFYDYLTAREFLDFYGRLQGLPAARRRSVIEETLARVGLTDRGDTPLRKFSKGMVQRLGLAQAIQHDPDLLILDEPMSGLDPIGRREVRDLILDQRARGTTVLFSSHILQDAELVCDRVAILVQGSLACVGTLDELAPHGARGYEVSIAGVAGEALPAEILAAENGRVLCYLERADELSRLFDAVHARGGEVLSVWPRRDTLEDLFLSKVRS